MEDRYPYEQHSDWEQDLNSKRRFWESLEAVGVDKVRIRLNEHPGGERSAITIGGREMTKGFASDWLAWHDRKKEKEKEHKQLQKDLQDAVHRLWQRAGIVLAFVVAIVTVLH